MPDSRCVECGRPKAEHAGDTLQCPVRRTERYNPVYASMDLPQGKTCSDCHHIRRCTLLIDVDATNTWCDWFPIRFIQKEIPSSAQ